MKIAKIVLALWILAASAHAQRALEEIFHYGFEMNGSLVGSLEVEVKRGGETEITSRLTAMLSLLGQDFDLKSASTCRIDSRSNRVLSYDHDLSLGDIKQGSSVVIEKGKVRFTSKSTGETRIVKVTPAVVFDNSLYFPYLLKDIGPGQEKVYEQFSYELGEIHEVAYTGLGEEKLTLAGKTVKTMLFGWVDKKLGARGKLWLDPATGRFLKMDQPNGIVLYAADAEVAEQIKRAEMDDSIFARVDVPYVDYKSLTYMKVKAKINTLGEWVTPESLNVPGQRFTGTVKDNLIDGIFEIRHIPYTGTSASAAPWDFSSDESLMKYLEPEELIESGDPVLAGLAKDLTEGLKNCWHAARLLSRWVNMEIAYKIPGGSARQTFDKRTGECGSQSRLLIAFCRAVGIPARTASGCMFTPYFGGSFGQHTWVEVYLGRAGWVSLDPTAGEPDFIDSGHLRIGSKASFNPVEMEVLDFEAGLESGGSAADLSAFDAMPWKTGKTYTYVYAFDSHEIGKDSFILSSVGEGGCHGTTELKVMERSASTEWKIDAKGRPLMYRLQGKSGTSEYSIECEFRGDSVVEKVLQAGQPFERTIKLPEKVFLLDNNNLSLFAVLAAALPLEEGVAHSIKAFHPSSMQVMPVKIKVERRESVPFNGEEVTCWLCSFDLDGYPLKLWVDDQGRLLKETEQNGRMLVTLEPSGI